jgi:heme-degrading monooxygenase HmoA
MTMILRRWMGRIRTADEAEYRAYIADTGGNDYLSTPGNLGWQMLFRDLGDGTSEVTTLSWWTDLADIKAFAGEDYERARYYPEDDRFLLDRPPDVDHFRVADGSSFPKP